MEGAFKQATMMKYNATDAPDLSRATSMREMFSSAVAFNGDISGWDVSHVTNMDSMFSGAEAFSQNLDPWYIQLDNLTLDEGAASRVVGTISAQNEPLHNQNPRVTQWMRLRGTIRLCLG